MTIAYLNNEFVPLEDARVSPMDRGFLFGDGIYEVIPSYGGRLVGAHLHLKRLERGLREVQMDIPWTRDDLLDIFEELLTRNGNGNLGIYLQITRGVTPKRGHAFPDVSKPTFFAYAFDIPAPPDGNVDSATLWTVSTGEDLRWQRCHIKSTSLLGNVLHMMEGINAGASEILLFDQDDFLTEAAACNVFIVEGSVIRTPALDQHKLAGITRDMTIATLRQYSDFEVRVEPVSRADVLKADEVWLSSSTKEIAPVIAIDGRVVGDGGAGPVWAAAQTLLAQHRFDTFE